MDQDPAQQVSTAETEVDHEALTTALRTVEATIDQIIEDDLKSQPPRMEYNPTGSFDDDLEEEKPSANSSEPKVELKLGDRYGEAVERTVDNDGKNYNVSYATKREAPQPDDSKPGPYDPYEFSITTYEWRDNNTDELTLMKNGTEVPAEEANDALADIRRVITDGQREERLHVQHRDHRRPQSLLGQAGTKNTDA